MKSAIAYLLMTFMIFSSCSLVSNRGPANIFESDDREAFDPLEYSGVGRLKKDLSNEHLWGTAFHVSACHIVSAYHVVKNPELEMTSEDKAYFLSPLLEEPIEATPVAWGEPSDSDFEHDNDWVILSLSECVDDERLEVFSFKRMSSLNEVRGLRVELVGYPEDRSPKNVSVDRNCQIGTEDPNERDGLGHTCATRPGSSGGPLYQRNASGEMEVVGINVASRSYFSDFISGYSPWIANRAASGLAIQKAFERLQ